MAKLLVVDDQRNMRTTLAMMLRGAGHDVDEAENGEAAVDRLSSEVYDLVLTDLKMGGTDGLDVLRAAKEVSQLTEVVLMTAYGTIESAVNESGWEVGLQYEVRYSSPASQRYSAPQFRVTEVWMSAFPVTLSVSAVVPGSGPGLMTG